MRRWPQRSALANLHMRPLSWPIVHVLVAENDQKRKLSLWGTSLSRATRVFLASSVRNSTVDCTPLTGQQLRFMPAYASSQTLLVCQTRPYSNSGRELAVVDSISTRMGRGREGEKGGCRHKPWSSSSDGGETLLEALRADIEAKRLRGVGEPLAYSNRKDGDCTIQESCWKAVAGRKGKEQADLATTMSAKQRSRESRVVASDETPNLLPEVAKEGYEEEQRPFNEENLISASASAPPHLRPLDRHYSDDEIEERVSGWIKAFAPVYAEQTAWGTARRWQTVRRGYKYRKGPITLTSSGLPKRDRRPDVVAERRREEIEGLSEELVEARCRFRWAILSVEQRRKWHDVLTREEKILFLEWAALEPCDVDGEARMAAVKRRQKERKEAGTHEDEEDDHDDDSSW